MDNFSDRPKFSDKWSSNQMSSLEEEEEENKNPKHSSYLRRFESLMKRKGDKGSSPRAKRKSLDGLEVDKALHKIQPWTPFGRRSCRASSRSPSTLKRLSTSSQAPTRRPLMSLHGSLRIKLTKSMRKSMMKGQQDYSNPGQLDYLQFMTALHCKSGHIQDAQEAQLQKKIDVEVRVAEGITKVLNACRRPEQALEAGKSFLASNARLNAYMLEMQTRKAHRALKHDSNLDGDGVEPCKATVIISDIRIPLVWKDSDSFLNRGDGRLYAAFCLVKINSTIHESSLLTDINRTTTDLSFDDIAVFEDVDGKFECSIEVYVHKRSHESRNPGTTPQKIKQKFSDISMSVGRRLSGMRDNSDLIGNMVLGPKFDCIARGTVKLSDADGSIGSFDLVLDHEANNAALGGHVSSHLPLFGQFCCRIIVRPTCLSDNTSQVGWITVKTASSNKGYSCWCRLDNSSLHGWPQPVEDRPSSQASFSVRLNKNLHVEPVSSSEDSHSFCLTLKNLRTNDTQYELSFESIDELTRWRNAILHRLADLVEWKHALTNPMRMPVNASLCRPKSSASRFSVANETLLGNSESPMTRVLNRLNIDASSDCRTSHAAHSFTCRSSTVTSSEDCDEGSQIPWPQQRLDL